MDPAGPFGVHSVTFVVAGEDGLRAALSCEQSSRDDGEFVDVKQKRFDFGLVRAAQREPRGRISSYL